MTQTPEIFCFPQAGADSTCFTGWQPRVPAGVRMVPVALPGRGLRIGEALKPDFQMLCDRAFAQLRGTISRPFVLLGSSMGGWMAYEIAFRLEQAGLSPELVVVLSSPTPDTPTTLPELRDPDRAVADILAVNPAFAEAAAHPELVEMVLPTIANDFRMCNAYAPIPGRTITTSIVGVTGDADHLAPSSSMTGWDNYTTGEFDLHTVVGGHDMHESPPDTLLDILFSKLGHVAGVRSHA